jgi:hypothetical protein
MDASNPAIIVSEARSALTASGDKGVIRGTGEEINPRLAETKSLSIDGVFNAPMSDTISVDVRGLHAIPEAELLTWRIAKSKEMRALDGVLCMSWVCGE